MAERKQLNNTNGIGGKCGQSTGDLGVGFKKGMNPLRFLTQLQQPGNYVGGND